MRKKRGKMRRKRGKCVKKGENHSDPIYTNPIKNLPKQGKRGIHHRSGKKGIHRRASDPAKDKRRVSTVVVQERKFSPKRKFWAGRPCGHPAKNFGQALQMLEKTSISERTSHADVHEKTSV